MEARGSEDDVPVINEILAREGTTSRAALLAAIDRLDAEAYLVDAGVAPAKLARLKDRLV
jgi:protein-tyrosine phosphatase